MNLQREPTNLEQARGGAGSIRNLLTSARVMIVDDEPANVRLLQIILERAGYVAIRATSDSREALGIWTEFKPDVLLLDLNMPHMNGLTLLRKIRELTAPEDFHPVLVLTADATQETKREALVAGANDFLSKPFDTAEVVLRLRNLVQARLLQLHMHTLIQERTRALEEAQVEILERLAQAGEFRDDDTGRHTRRVGDLSARLAEELGCEPSFVGLIKLAAPLHDLGKIAIPDSILLKPGPLDAAERALMQTHTTKGAAILSSGRSELVSIAEEIAHCHHERWDGNGYPRRLRGEEIPLSARIVAVTDFFDALTHDRPYRRAWAPDQVISEIEAGAGSHFDPRVSEAFLRLMDGDCSDR